MQTRKKGKKNSLVVAVLLVVAFGMLGLGNVIPFFIHPPSASLSSRDLALSCTTDEQTKFHIHPHLAIVVNGATTTIPANIGITLNCEHPLHTHDASGTIHVESPEQRNFTLSDFFAVWGEPFGKTQIFGYEADAGHEITMTVDGKPSADYENLVLKDGQQIVIKYGKTM